MWEIFTITAALDQYGSGSKNHLALLTLEEKGKNPNRKDTRFLIGDAYMLWVAKT